MKKEENKNWDELNVLDGLHNNEGIPHFPIPLYWNWQWYKKFDKKKENIIEVFKNFFNRHHKH